MARLAAQMDAYEPLPGLRVNGTLTAAESMGDLGGLAIAFRAYKLSLKGNRSSVIDGLTGEQRFFMGWARIWRSKERDEYLRSTLQTNAVPSGCVIARTPRRPTSMAFTTPSVSNQGTGCIARPPSA